MKKIYVILIFIILMIPLFAESKNMKIIYFDSNLSAEIQGKIISNNTVVNIKNITYENEEEKFWWHYTNPIIFGKYYFAIKNYRYWAKKPYYTTYSIQILDHNFNYKEELFKVRNKNINNIAYNKSKKLIAFSIVEKDENDEFVNKKSLLKIYDLKKKKILLTKEMGGMGENLLFTTRAFNSYGDLICLEKSITESQTKGDVTRYQEKGSNIVIYNIKKDEETVIDKGSEASFVTDNLIMYRNKNIRSLYLYNLKTKKKEKYFSCSLKDIIANYFISPDNKQIIIIFNSRFIVGKASRFVLYDFETKEVIKWDLLKEIKNISHIDWQFAE